MNKFCAAIAALLFTAVLQGADKTKLLVSHDLVTADDLTALYKTPFAIKEESNSHRGAIPQTRHTVTDESSGAGPHWMVTVIFRQFSTGAEAYAAYKLTRGSKVKDFDSQERRWRGCRRDIA